MSNNKKTILLPDVHGRTFWKEIVDFDCDIVFLGDYVDPYQHEGITKKRALDNFNEIIEFAKSRNNVYLLYGNHDCEYSIGQDVCDVRCDYKNFDKIRGIFLDNKGLFKFCHIIEVNGKKIVLSHAGFHPEWVKRWKITPDDINDYTKDEDLFDKLHLALSDVSRFRGGWNLVGSPIWSDIREYSSANTPEEYEQIVGHTMLRGDKALRFRNVTCIDLKRPFLLDDDGELKELDGSVVEIVKC